MEQNESVAVEPTEVVESQDNTNTDESVGQVEDGFLTPFSETKVVDDVATQDEVSDIQYEDFKIPEDWTVDQDLIANFKEFGKNKGLSQEDMQAVIDYHVEANKKALEQYNASAKKLNKDWYEEIKNDEEFGGENFKTSNSNINYLFEKFDTDGKLRKALESSGASTHPDLYRFLARIGKTHANDGPNNKQHRTTQASVPITEQLWPKGTMPIYGETRT